MINPEELRIGNTLQQNWYYWNSGKKELNVKVQTTIN